MLQELLQALLGGGGQIPPVPMTQPGDPLPPDQLGVPPGGAGGLTALLGGGASGASQPQAPAPQQNPQLGQPMQMPQQAPAPQARPPMQVSAQSRQPAPQQRQPMPQPQSAPQQGGGLANIFGGGDSGGLFGGDSADFSDFMGRLGPMLMIMSGDPRYTRTGAALLGQHNKNARTREEKRVEKKKQALLFQFLRNRKVSQQDALAMVTNPELGKAWIKREFAEPDKPSALDQKVQALVESGAEEDIAKGIAAGRYATTRDPITGAAQVIDKATGKIVFPKRGQPSEPTQAPQPEQRGAQPQQKAQTSLYDLAPQATGVFRAAESLWTDIAPQVPGAERKGYPETVEAIQQLAVAQNELIRALSINPRFPVGEINRIKEEVKIEPSAFTSVEGMQARMRAVDQGLRMRLQNELNAANDPNLPADTRRAASQAANDIKNFLDRLGAPQNGASGPSGPSLEDTVTGAIGSTPSVNTKAEYDQLPSGTVFIAPDGKKRRKP